MQMVADLEIEMMSDMYRRMTDACQEKCISCNFKEGDLTKDESVCLARGPHQCHNKMNSHSNHFIYALQKASAVQSES
ncbi:unnamed protein product, partial [Mesorhabditis belari]|uniref:Mitochondrial import inner membrane translocase subunit n=1 Tax=Mesorhabditis belari TaxID=2138241 RepID=A0AAF3J260_9BILA